MFKKGFCLLVLVCATGFNAMALPYLSIGLNGVFGFDFYTGDGILGRPFDADGVRPSLLGDASGGAGFLVEIGFTRFFALQPEFGINYQARNIFIESNLFLKGKYNWFYGMMAPSLQFSVDGEKHGLRAMYIGAIAEVGFEIPLGPGYLTTGLRSKWNFNTMYKDGRENFRVHQPVSLQLGYLWRV